MPKHVLFKVLILFLMSPDHKIAQKFKVSKIRHYMLAMLAECNMHILTSKPQQRVIGDADLIHTVTDTLHIFRTARVKAELHKQTGSSVPKARNLNDSAINNIMVTGNLTPQTKPDTGDCVWLLLLTGLGVGWVQSNTGSKVTSPVRPYAFRFHLIAV